MLLVALALGAAGRLGADPGSDAAERASAAHANRDDEPEARLVPLADVSAKVELAPPMGELQRLTHKLSLSIGGRDLELTAFYAYESLELLREIQREIPEYDGHPIALLIDRMAMPAYETSTRALTAAGDSASPARTREVEGAVAGLVAACNGCHEATRHGFIRITDERSRNPFNQDFERR